MSCQLQIVINGSSTENITDVLNNISYFASNVSFCATKREDALSPSSDGSGDATWILTSAFIIFTMQSGFGLLEAGMS